MWLTLITAIPRKHRQCRSSFLSLKRRVRVRKKRNLRRKAFPLIFLNISAKSLHLPKMHKLIYLAKCICCCSLVSILLIFMCIFAQWWLFVCPCRWQQWTGSRVSRMTTSSCHWSAPKPWDTWGNYRTSMHAKQKKLPWTKIDTFSRYSTTNILVLVTTLRMQVLRGNNTSETSLLRLLSGGFLFLLMSNYFVAFAKGKELNSRQGV